MGLIQIQNVTKQLGERVILRDVSLELHSGETVGLVGPNGAGKTTLFRLIAGKMSPDVGTVTRSRGLEIGYLPQDPEVNLDNTLHDEAAEAFADLLGLERRMHELSEKMAHTPPGAALDALMDQYERANAHFLAADGYSFEQRLNEILGGVGFAQRDYQLPVRALSGGQKCRLALAKLLMQDRQFLLLDEPTNHLDIDAVRWLEKFLTGHRGGAVIISHDRYLLDRLSDRIVELENARLFSYPGNYTNYARTKAVRRLTQERQYEQDREFIEKEREFIAKHLAGQRSSEAKGRRTRLERRIADGEFVLEKPSERPKLRIDLAEDVALRGRTILETAGLTKRYGEKTLFAELTLQVQAGQRLGITGPNGTGKSTLLKIAMGKVPADAGAVRIDPKAIVGYYAQDAMELDPQSTVIDAVREARPGMSEEQGRNYLARFLFRGEDVFKRVGALSGGEQSRTRLARLLLLAPNTLVLDEPTNHLDIPSREVLEEALADYAGTIIVVSHDRYFLDRIVNRLLVMRAGEHTIYNGNYSFYIEQVEQAAARASAVAAKAAAPARSGQPGEAGERSRRGEARKPAAKRSPLDKLTLEELEAYIAERDARLADLNNQFADPANLRDKDAVARLQTDYDRIKAERDEAETAWYQRLETGG